ncbi:MAG: barstar family protein [Oscillospiraceae bacterium]|nr:barstar family protein [Oscillospiraceae bacterium]
MEERVEATLDLTDCKYLGELHQRIKVALDFPEHYGENWSAFWDSLRFDSPVEYVRIVGECTMPENLKKHLDKMHEILQRCKDERAAYGFSFEYEIID